MENVILVDAFDNEIGVMEKIEAHKKGLLHRAISVFIFNTQGEWLLQQRAISKYHSGGLWTNTCCTHPQPNETNIDAANRRLNFEMGIQVKLTEIFTFSYIEKFDNHLIENEFDHVFFGTTDQIPNFNTDEVRDYKYVSYSKLIAHVDSNPNSYTAWFKKIVNRVNCEISKFETL